MARWRPEPRLALVLALAACGGSATDDVDPALYSATPTYARDIVPLFADRCVLCHASTGVRDGGVELDTYESAYSGRVHNACVSVREVFIEQFADVLMPVARIPPVEQKPCADWEPFSMPKGAKSPLTSSEQVLLLRWVETGAPQ